MKSADLYILSQRSYQWQDKTVLVVDNDPDNILLLTTILRSTNCKIITARTGPQALEVFYSTEKIDVLITELVLPVIDGFEIMKIMKVVNSKLIVFVASSQVTKKDRKRCFELGADGFVAKPFDVIEVMVKVDVLIDYYSNSNRQIKMRC